MDLLCAISERSTFIASQNWEKWDFWMNALPDLNITSWVKVSRICIINNWNWMCLYSAHLLRKPFADMWWGLLFSWFESPGFLLPCQVTEMQNTLWTKVIWSLFLSWQLKLENYLLNFRRLSLFLIIPQNLTKMLWSWNCWGVVVKDWVCITFLQWRRFYWSTKQAVVGIHTHLYFKLFLLLFKFLR